MLKEINQWLDEPLFKSNKTTKKALASESTAAPKSKTFKEWLDEPLFPAKVTTKSVTTTKLKSKSFKEWLEEPVFPIAPEDGSKAPGLVVLHKPKYIYLKIVPMTSVRNYDSDKIVQLIASFYKNTLSRIQFMDKQFHIELAPKVGYYIYMEKQRVEFYFIVPETYKVMVMERISDTWKGITILEVDKLPEFDKTSACYKLDYKKEDAFSVEVDARTNTLLSSMLNVLNVVEDGDRIGVFYNFQPTSQYSWQATYKNTLEKYKANMPVEKQKLSVAYGFKLALFLLLEGVNIVVESASALLGEVAESKSSKYKRQEDDTLTGFMKLQRMNEITPATKQKRDSVVVKTQVVIMSDSSSKQKAANNGKSVCQSYKTITGDNEIIHKTAQLPKSLENFDLTGGTSMSMTPKECQNLLALPGYDLLESHKCIEKVATSESEIPKELRQGVMCLGTNTYRGQKQKAYITTDPNLKNLALVLIGPTRAGKSTLISNLSRDALNNGECTILFDFCGNCKLSDEVSAVVDNVLDIRCDDFKSIQGLGYNEMSSFKSDDVFVKYNNAKVQTSQLLALVNSVNASDRELKAKMEGYLESASLVTFLVGGSVRDVFRVLQDHKTRAKFIQTIPPEQTENMLEYVSSLESLDDTDKTGKISGTKYHLIAGIIDRVNKLKQNTYMELMFKKDCANNINLCDEIQKNQLICLRMPEVMFTTEAEKDSYTTYWITKIWLALQIRNWMLPVDKHVKVNIVVDELYQVPNTQEFLRSKLSQMAKFTSKIIISAHYLGQIGIIRNELKAANSSYCLISGCDKDNFNELKNELKPFELEDLLNLKRYHSLNLLRYEHGYANFITALPPELPKKNTKAQVSNSTNA